METRPIVPHRFHTGLRSHIDAHLPHACRNKRRGIGFITMQNAIRELDNGDLGAEPGHRFTEFAADRATTNNHERCRSCPRVEETLVRQIRNLIEPVDRRCCRTATGRNNDVLRPDVPAIDLDCAWPNKGAPSFDHVDAVAPQHFGILTRSNCCHDSLDTFDGISEVQALARSLDQRLRWHTTGERAVATKWCIADKCNRRAFPTGSTSRGETSCSPAHNEHVVVSHWHTSVDHAGQKPRQVYRAQAPDEVANIAL